jgi:hypothetical protein
MKKGIGPRGLGAPKSMAKMYNSPAKKMTDPPKKAFKKELKPLGYTKTSTKKSQDPNVFTDTYNAATGEYNDPYYNPARAKQYEKNAIDKYGSLEASREATRTNYPSLTKNKKLQKPILRGGNKLK